MKFDAFDELYGGIAKKYMKKEAKLKALKDKLYRVMQQGHTCARMVNETGVANDLTEVANRKIENPEVVLEEE